MAAADGTVDGQTLARLFDCTDRQIRKYAAEGLVVRSGRGRYNLALSIRNVFKHLRDQASGRRGSHPDVDAITENALLRREQRKNYELKNALLEGTVVPVEAIEPAWARVVRAGRTAVMAIPGRARFALPHLTAADQTILEEICRDQLEAAAIVDEPPKIDLPRPLNDEELTSPGCARL